MKCHVISLRINFFKKEAAFLHFLFLLKVFDFAILDSSFHIRGLPQIDLQMVGCVFILRRRHYKSDQKFVLGSHCSEHQPSGNSPSVTGPPDSPVSCVAKHRAPLDQPLQRVNYQPSAGMSWKYF